MNHPSPLEAIFFAALEKGAAPQRAAYLDEACAGDPDLRQRVERMLAAQAQAGSFLEQPALSPALTVDEQPVSERPGSVIGPYKLMEQIGEGGMGLVFVAEQQHPVRRKVALKVIKPGMDTRQVIARFEAERQALALMDHPYIAKVLDGGETAGGRPYFVMELVKGVPITAYCDENQMPVRARLELFVHVCQAVQHAHQKGIIHRDLKPSNVLVMSHDGTPVVKVIDFGVAKALGQQLTDKTIYTQFAQLVGTPQYMAPEQAGESGLDVDTRSDVYSLGVLLYELLTGTTPFHKKRFKEAGYDEIRRIIREEEPPRPSTRISTLGQAATTIAMRRQSDPRRLSQLFRGELDWVVMKALEKDRTRRYETASTFAADVQRYLHDQPVAACPPSSWYRFRKFARRNRVALAIAAAAALAGILALLGFFVSYAQIDAARGQAEANAEEERDARAAAGKAQKQAEDKAEESRQRLVRLTVAQGVRLMDEGNLLGSLPWFTEALRLDQGDAGREAIHRIRLAAALHQCPRLVQVWAETELAEFSPDGRRVVTAHRNGKTARLWDAASGQPLTAPLRLEEGIADVAFRGQRCCGLTTKGNAARVWDLVSGEPITAPLEHDSRVKMASFSPDGSRVATWCVDKTVRVWEGSRCRLVTRPLNLARLPDGEIRGYAPNAGSLRPWFSADSRHLLLLVYDGHGELQVWDVAEGRLITTLSNHNFYSAALSPDGHRIATGHRFSSTVGLWDVTKGGRFLGQVGHGNTRGPINGLSFSPDGRQLVTANDMGTAHGCNMVSRWPVWAGPWPLKHGAGVNGAWFSPDGRQVLTASKDGTARVWGAATGQALGSPLLHGRPVESAAFSPDGHRVLTWAGAPGGARVVRLWDLAPAQTVPPHKDIMRDFDWRQMTYETINRADGIVVARLKGQPLRVWDYATGKPLSAPLNISGKVTYAELSHDRSRLITLSYDPGAWRTHLIAQAIAAQGAVAPGTAASLVPQAVVSLGAAGFDVSVLFRGGVAEVWDVATGQRVGPPREDCNANPHLSPDGRRLVTMNRQGTTQIWDVASGQRLGPPLQIGVAGTRFGQEATFSPDGRWVVIREDATVRLWDGRARQATTLLPQHSDAVVRASFSGDSRRLVTASRDGTACVWDVSTGRLLCAPLRHGSAVSSAALSADGRLVATLSEDKNLMVRVWDAVTGEAVTPYFRSGSHPYWGWVGTYPTDVVFSPGGRLLGRLRTGEVRQWDLAPDGLPVQELVSFGGVLSGHRIDPVSGLVPLEEEKRQHEWTELRARYPKSFASSPQAVLAWRAEQADACQEEKEWAAAIWHLDRLIAGKPKQWKLYFDRGGVRARLKQWDRAIADHSRAIGLGGDERLIRHTRGGLYAVQGQWDKAAADYARAVELLAVELSPDGTWLGLWYAHAVLRLKLGDAKGYRQACHKLRDGRRGRRYHVSKLVWACVLGADGLEDYAPLLDIAEKTVRRARLDYACARALGGALLRAGRLEAAVQQLQKVASLEPGVPFAPLLLAMAHHRLGHADEARRWLDKAGQMIEQVLRQRPKTVASEDTITAPDELVWTERLSLQLLRREAEALIRGPAAKGKEGPADKK
jgi:WD40 repeat protein/serine/threonine protein kinase/tetratricopeptide (TPR) repeat protein